MRSRRLVLFDSDGVNPHGRELALLLDDRPLPVVLLLASDAQWVPAGLTVRTVLPGNRSGRSRLAQAAAALHGVATVVRLALPRNPCLVLWTRSPLEDLVFAFLALLGVPVAVVVHQADARSPRSRLRAFTTRQLRRRASWIVVHSARLADEVRADVHGRPVWACGFPPFRTWPRWAGAVRERRRAPGDVLRLVFLGQLRPDKNLDELPEILGALSADDRGAMRLTVCGKGAMHGGLRARLAGLVELDDRRSPDFIADAELGIALHDADVLVAPYQGASQSATVVLALGAGLEVLSYDDGSIGEVLDDAGLVPPGDRAEFARRLASARAGCRLGAPRLPLDLWAEECATSWRRLFAGELAPTAGDGDWSPR